MRWVLRATAMLMLAVGTGCSAAAQQDTEGAEQFARSLYAAYTDDPDAPAPMAGDDPQIWSTRMAALIARNEALAEGQPPYIDFDPICGCQDWEGVKVVDTEAEREPDGAVRVTVRFLNFDQEQSTVLKLRQEAGSGWRIDDVLEAGIPSLSARVEASNRRLEAGGEVNE